MIEHIRILKKKLTDDMISVQQLVSETGIPYSRLSSWLGDRADPKKKEDIDIIKQWLKNKGVTITEIEKDRIYEPPNNHPIFHNTAKPASNEFDENLRKLYGMYEKYGTSVMVKAILHVLLKCTAEIQAEIYKKPVDQCMKDMIAQIQSEVFISSIMNGQLS